MSLPLLVIAILNGLVTGVIYALMGVGLSVILGLLNIPNFAHGALYALGAYFFISMAHGPLGFGGGLLVALVGVAVLGALTESLGVRRLYRVHPDYTLLLTFGLALIATEVIIIVWGPVGITYQPPAWLAGTLDLGITFYPKYRFAVMLFTGCLILVCWLFVERTKYGAILRAGIEDKEMASVLGINIRRVFTVTFAIGTGLAGLGGALMAPVHGLLPSMGVEVLPFAFVVVVLGGLGSLPGAILAGLLVGIVQSVMTVMWAPAANVAVFVMMALGLILRPQGLVGAR
jgi:branched-chain amino acid transport system permease protein